MKIDIKRRIVCTPSGLAIREIQGGEGEPQKESRTIEGKAIVFNEATVLYEDSQFVEREIILPSCITAEFLAEQDVKLNLLHEHETTFARNNKGVGALALEIREDGLYFSVEAPKCSLGEQALELVRNKTYTGCSCEFRPRDYEIQERTLEDGRTEYTIIHKTFERLAALTIAMDPAYATTEVVASTREAIKTEAKAEKERIEREAFAMRQREQLKRCDEAMLKRQLSNNY